MSEIEAAAADSVGSLFRRKPKHELPHGTPCPNCATPLEGAFCHACGQRAEDYHRSIVKLGAEALEGLFELDGRLFRTLPNLIARPGKLTCDYLEGHRTPQIPPFRLFLIVVVLVFFAGDLQGAGKQAGPDAVAQAKREAKADLAKDGIDLQVPQGAGAADGKKDAANLTDAQRKEAAKVQQDVKAALAQKGITIDVPGVHVQTSDDNADAKTEGVHINVGQPGKDGVIEDGQTKNIGPMGDWLLGKGRAIADNQDAFKANLETWGHRLAILALPMSASILGLLFVFRRRFYLFDHLIFSMHSLSFQGLLLSAILILNHLMKTGAWWVLILAMPVHLFLHMRRVYSRGVFTTLLRMAFLFIASCVGATLIMALVFALGAMDMKSSAAAAAVSKPLPAPTTSTAKDHEDDADADDDKTVAPAKPATPAPPPKAPSPVKPPSAPKP